MENSGKFCDWNNRTEKVLCLQKKSKSQLTVYFCRKCCNKENMIELGKESTKEMWKDLNGN